MSKLTNIWIAHKLKVKKKISSVGALQLAGLRLHHNQQND